MNFIKCSDKETIEKLKKLGYPVISESNGVATFINKPSSMANFSDNDKVVYTNKLEM